VSFLYHLIKKELRCDVIYMACTLADMPLTEYMWSTDARLVAVVLECFVIDVRVTWGLQLLLWYRVLMHTYV